MANNLSIEIGAMYDINGDIFQLVGLHAHYFTLVPLKVNNIYHTGDDGFVTMKAVQFSKAKLYKGLI